MIYIMLNFAFIKKELIFTFKEFNIFIKQCDGAT